MINLLTLQSDYPSLGRLNRRTQSHSPRPRTRNRMLRIRPTHLLPVPCGHRRPQKAPSTNLLLGIHSNRQPRQIRTSVGLPGHAPQDTARSRQLGEGVSVSSGREIPAERKRRQDNPVLGPDAGRALRQDGGGRACTFCELPEVGAAGEGEREWG